MQVRTDNHTRLCTSKKEEFEINERKLDEDDQRFFKLFQESTFEESRAAALEMKKFAKRQTKQNQKFLFYHSLRVLLRSDSEMLSWPNSPLLVMLEFVDPNVLFGGEQETSLTPLHVLADLADPFEYSTHENQVILAKQLIEHGADVNAVSIPHGRTPLHNACSAGVVTNLDFVELLLEAGADLNAQRNHMELTPLGHTTPDAPGAAKFLLNWPTTDANITTGSGEFFLTTVRSLITAYSEVITFPDNPKKVQQQFLLQQWREIEEMLVERGAHEIDITVFE
jgi:hypothetical protein